VTVQLAASCDLAGAREVTSEQPGARRYVRIDRDLAPSSVIRFYAFRGGCISERFVAGAAGSSPERMATEASLALGFVTREALAEALSRRSSSRLELNP
jgi:hypothetical protein